MVRVNRISPSDKNSLRYTHIAALGKTTIISGAAGYLKYVTVNSKGGAGSKLTIFDNSISGGTVIGIIDTATMIGSNHYEVECISGITVSHELGTTADITISSTKNMP